MVLVFMFAEAKAQSSSSTPAAADAQVIKTYAQPLYQFNPRIDFLLKNNRTSLYLESVMNVQYAYSSLVEQYYWNGKFGIDHAITNKMYIGISEKLNYSFLNSTSKISLYDYTTRVYLQHSGKIKSLLFLKEVLYEQFNYTNGTLTLNTNQGSTVTKLPTVGRIGLGLGLGKYFKIGKNQLAVFGSYRAFVEFDLKNNKNSYFNNRFIDYTLLRLDAGYLINKSLYIGVYVARDTNFGYVVASTPYDSNNITPIGGLVCNLILNPFSDSKKQENEAFRYFYTK